MNVINYFISKKNIYFWFILLFFGLIFITISIANHYYFRTYCYDYAIFNNAFFDLAHFRANHITVLDPLTKNFFATHIAIPLIIFIPFYWLFYYITGTYTLLIIQVVVVLIGGWALYKLILFKSKNIWVSICALLYYFLLQGRYSAFTSDYIDTTIGASIIPVFFYFFEKKKYVYAYLSFLFIILTKENMPLWFVFISITLILFNLKNKKELKFLIGIFVTSFFYFLLAMYVLIPYFIKGTENTYTGFNYSAIGSNLKEAVIFLFSHPIDSIKMLFENHLNNPAYDGIKKEFYWVYIISGGFLLFYRPVYLLMFIPILAQKMYNDSPVRWGIEWFYSIEFVSLLPVVVFLIISNNFKKLKIYISIIVCALTLYVTLDKMKIENRKMAWWGLSKEYIFDKQMFSSNDDVSYMHSLLGIIPKDSTVVASQSIVPHLAYREKIYCFPYVRDANYMILRVGDPYPLPKKEYDSLINKYLNDPDWKIIISKFPLIILTKNNTNNFNESVYCNMDSVIINKDVKLFINNEKTFMDGQTQSSVNSFSGKYSAELTQNKPYACCYIIKNVEQGDHIKLKVWRKSKNPINSYLILASSSTTDDFYIQQDKSSLDSLGWEKLIIDVIINKNITNKTLKTYLWNSGKDTIFFDDFEIKKTRNVSFCK